MSKIDLWHGDCLELMKDIPDGSVDLILTDPPYQKTKLSWDTVISFEPMWEQLKRIIKPNGAICLFGVEPFSSRLRLSNEKMFKYDWVWDKKKVSNPMMAKKRPLSQHELIHVFYGKQPNYYPQPYLKKTIGRLGQGATSKTVHTSTPIKAPENDNKYGYPRSIINEVPVLNNLGKDKSGYHPTQKPTALLEYLIRTYTLEGETVLDFTMGSGSTGVAAKNLNRSFIGIELDEDYFEIARKRIEQAQNEQK